MASIPLDITAPSPRELMTLGMFLFGMDSFAYQSLQRSRSWRHGVTERHGARDASQYLGPGPDTISLAGLLVPELGGTYSAIETLAAMADTGQSYPLMDGYGQILGQYRIIAMDEDHLAIMAGGIPRHVDFSMDLERAADQPPAQNETAIETQPNGAGGT